MDEERKNAGKKIEKEKRERDETKTLKILTGISSSPSALCL